MTSSMVQVKKTHVVMVQVSYISRCKLERIYMSLGPFRPRSCN